MTPTINSTTRRIFPLVLSLAALAAAQGAKIDRPSNFEPPTKEEGGILTTLVNSYMAVRNSVKFAYDEIIYFERMYETYEEIGHWFDKNQRRVENIFDATNRLFTDPKDVFTTLRRMEKIFDQVDYLYYYEAQKFDRLIAGGENLWDVATARSNTYTGLIVPNTNEVIEYVEGLFAAGPNHSLSADEVAKLSPEEYEEYLSNYLARNRLATVKTDNWPDERARRASVLIASSTMAKSGAYNKWSIKANNHITDLDKSFAAMKGVNQIMMAGVWYDLENVNANNKKVRHSLEELKVLQGLLGFDMYKSSKKRSEEIHFSNGVADLKYGLMDLH